MIDISIHKKYLLISLLIIVGIVLSFIYKFNYSFSNIYKSISYEQNDGSIDNENDTTTNTPFDLEFPNPKQPDFNQAIADGDKYLLKKDYLQAVAKYDEALEYIESQIAYIRLFNTYNVIGDVDKALEAIDKAISLRPSHADYWGMRIQFLDEKTEATYDDLSKIYEEGIAKSSNDSKINLVLVFARIAENNGQNKDAARLWQYAIELYPENTELYQVEIDRLNLVQ